MSLERQSLQNLESLIDEAARLQLRSNGSATQPVPTSVANSAPLRRTVGFGAPNSTNASNSDVSLSATPTNVSLPWPRTSISSVTPIVTSGPSADSPEVTSPIRVREDGVTVLSGGALAIEPKVPYRTQLSGWSNDISSSATQKPPSIPSSHSIPIPSTTPAGTSVPRRTSRSSSQAPSTAAVTETPADTKSNVPPKVQMTKAERRQLQERQRTEKLSRQGSSSTNPVTSPATESVPAVTTPRSTVPASMRYDDPKQRTKAERQQPLQRTPVQKQVPLFSHLPQYERESSFTRHLKGKEPLHPAVVQLGLMYGEQSIVGANARCLAMLHAFQQVIMDYQTPPNRVLNRHLDAHLKPHINYLVQFRPLATTMSNAIRYLKTEIASLQPDLPEAECKTKLLDGIDSYIRDRIHMAHQFMLESGLEKIRDQGDVLLVYAHSSIVCALLMHAWKSGKRFRVIVVDGRPLFEGRKTLRRLTDAGIPCTYAPLTALSYVIREATTVLLGAHCMFGNGNLMARAGTALVAMAGHERRLPVMVCCETYKFAERVQLDSFVFNEIGDPDDLVARDAFHQRVAHVPGGIELGGIDLRPNPEHPSEHTALADWRDVPSLRLLNVMYDVTPARLISLVLTEVGLIPCTSVPVVLREYRPAMAN